MSKKEQFDYIWLPFCQEELISKIFTQNEERLKTQVIYDFLNCNPHLHRLF